MRIALHRLLLMILTMSLLASGQVQAAHVHSSALSPGVHRCELSPGGDHQPIAPASHSDGCIYCLSLGDTPTLANAQPADVAILRVASTTAQRAVIIVPRIAAMASAHRARASPAFP